MFAKWGEIKKNIKVIVFFMIGIYGSFMVLKFRSLDFGTRMEMEVWNNLVESWSRARINSNQLDSIQLELR